MIIAPALLAKRAAASSTAFIPAPGPSLSWHLGQSLYSGSFNPATGNAHFQAPVCGWGGTGGGLSFGLFYSSQSARSSSLGPKWSHSFGWRILGTSPATVIAGDGTETVYTLSGSSYAAPIGVYDMLARNADGTWTLTQKMGTRYNFRADGTLGSIVDLNGNTTSCLYTGSSLTSVSDPAGRALGLAYTGGLLASVTDLEGRTWTLSYDGAGRLAQVNDPPLNGVTYARRFGYDASGNLSSHTNRVGKAWAFAYGANGVLSSQTDPDGKLSGGTAGVNNPVAPQVAANGAQRLGAQSAPQQQPLSWPSNVVAAGGWTDPTGASVQYGYDAAGRVVAVQGATDERAVLGYDAANNKSWHQTDSGATWQWGYDGKGNKLTSTDPLNLTTQATYDVGNRLLTSTDPAGKQTQHSYDGRGNLASVTDALSNVTGYAYDAAGNQTQVTDSMNRVTKHAYDGYGNRTQVTDPLNNVTTYQYMASRVTQWADAVGRVTTYAYDAWGRRTGVTYPTTGNPGVALALDAEGRTTQSVDGTGTRTYSYDSWGRKVGMTDPMGNTAAAYDGAGRMQTQTDVSGRTHSYAYDGSSRLQSVGDGSGTVAYAYNSDSRPSTVSYPNGTQATYGYDTAGRVTSLAHKLVSTGATIISYAAQYDNAGRLTQVTEQPSGAVTTYNYDNAGHLLSESRTGQNPYSGSYTYDTSGLRKTATTVTNGATTHSGTYSYDGAGRLASVVDSATGLTEQYGWNADGTLASYPGPGYTRRMAYNEDGHLTQISRDYGGGNVQPAYQYAYGADGGRRWRKDLANNVWTWYPCGVACCAGQLVEMQSDLTGNSWSTSAQYLRGLGPIRRNGEYHHFDPMGNAGVITNSSGAVLSSNLYDKFDVPRYAQGSAQTPQRPSGLLTSDEGLLRDQSSSNGYIAGRSTQTLKPAIVPLPWPILAVCAAACIVAIVFIAVDVADCVNNVCDAQRGVAKAKCVANCIVREVGQNPVDFAVTAGCVFCICVQATNNPIKCILWLKKVKEEVPVA